MARDSWQSIVKRRVCLGVAAIGLFAVAWAIGDRLGTSRRREVTAGLEPTAFPGVFVDHHVADLGIIAPDHVAEASFTLRNMGPGFYSVKKITASCSCATVDLTNTALPPQGSLSIPVHMSTSSILTDDAFEKAVLVELSQDNGDPNLKDVFRFKGQIDRSGTFVAWPGVIDCGDTVPNGKISATVYFKADLKLLEQLPSEIEVSKPSHEINLSPVDHSKRLGVKPVRLVSTIPANAPEGPFTSSITVKTPVQPIRTAHVVLRARITSGVAVTPEQVFIAVAQNGTPVRAIVTVRSIDERPLAVDRVTTSLPLDWTVRHEQQGDHALVVVLSCAETRFTNWPLRDTVMIRLTDGRTVAVPVVMVLLKGNDASLKATTISSDCEPAA